LDIQHCKLRKTAWYSCFFSYSD